MQFPKIFLEKYPYARFSYFSLDFPHSLHLETETDKPLHLNIMAGCICFKNFSSNKNSVMQYLINFVWVCAVLLPGNTTSRNSWKDINHLSKHENK